MDTENTENINLDENDNQQEPLEDTNIQKSSDSLIISKTDEISGIPQSNPSKVRKGETKKSLANPYKLDITQSGTQSGTKTESESKQEIDKDEDEDEDEDEDSRKDLEKHVKNQTSLLHRMMAMLRYKYEYYEFQNLIINIIIILCSSVITFLESLRANLPSDPDVNFWFTIITLSLGFIIAFSLSLFKFLKIQDKMEIIQSGILGLEGPYKEICEYKNEVETYWKLQKIQQDKKSKDLLKKAITKYKSNEDIVTEGKYAIDGDLKNDEDVTKKWKRIGIKAVHPLTHADAIINSGEYYVYEKKYREIHLKTKKMQDKIILRLEAQENLKVARGIILDDMLKPTSELFEKYGRVTEMKKGNDVRLEYWNEGVIMSNNIQEKYNKILGIKAYDKCFDNCVDLYCCFCNSWCKKFFKSIIYFVICCCPCCRNWCSNKSTRKHEWEKEEREEIV